MTPAMRKAAIRENASVELITGTPRRGVSSPRGPQSRGALASLSRKTFGQFPLGPRPLPFAPALRVVDARSECRRAPLLSDRVVTYDSANSGRSGRGAVTPSAVAVAEGNYRNEITIAVDERDCRQ